MYFTQNSAALQFVCKATLDDIALLSDMRDGHRRTWYTRPEPWQSLYEYLAKCPVVCKIILASSSSWKMELLGYLKPAFDTLCIITCISYSPVKIVVTNIIPRAQAHIIRDRKAVVHTFTTQNLKQREGLRSQSMPCSKCSRHLPPP